MSKSEEIYISVDIEADGPIPGPNSMLSLGAAAFNADGDMVGTFSVNFDLLPGATPDPDTMKWWGEPKQKAAWDACRMDLVSPVCGMTLFVDWVEGFNGVPVFVGYPAAYDWIFTYWYIRRFTDESPFSFSALDVKTYAMCMLKCGYRSVSKKAFPKRWLSSHKHTHVALDDAIEQGEIFINMLKENTGRS